MAYVVDLEDEYADADVPTTIVRSKADCPTVDVSFLWLNIIVADCERVRSYSKTCLNATLNKWKFCINWLLDRVLM